MTSLWAEEHGGKAWCAASMPIKRACSWNPERLSDFQFGQSRKPRKRDLGGYERLHVQARMMARYGVVRRGRWRDLRGWCRGGVYLLQVVTRHDQRACSCKDLPRFRVPLRGLGMTAITQSTP